MPSSFTTGHESGGDRLSLLPLLCSLNFHYIFKGKLDLERPDQWIIQHCTCSTNWDLNEMYKGLQDWQPTELFRCQYASNKAPNSNFKPPSSILSGINGSQKKTIQQACQLHVIYTCLCNTSYVLVCLKHTESIKYFLESSASAKSHENLRLSALVDKKLF